MSKVYEYLKQLSETPIEKREMFIESMKIRSYSSPEISETDIWILSIAAENNEYLEKKLKEAEELSIDTEAPEEDEEELTLDSPEEELTLDEPEETSTEDEEDEKSVDDSEEELSIDSPEEELTLDEPEETDSKDSSDEKDEIETSKEGIGILPLIAEIQEKLASGKPSEVELAALKALKKLVS